MSRFRFVDDHRDTYQVKRLCRARRGVPVGLLPLGQRRPVGPGGRRCRAARGDPPDPHRQSRCTYGAPRVHGQLRRRGHRVGCKRVARLMRTEGLMGVHKRRWRRRRPDIAPAPDRLNRDFTAAAPEPAVGGRHHRVPHRRGQAPPRRGPGPVPPGPGRLVHGRRTPTPSSSSTPS